MIIKAVDLFCGAGGTSTGIIKAVRERLKKNVQLVAVNHWQTAINSHQLNHPGVRHICEPVENLHPRTVIPSGYLDLLAASTECTFFSGARGGGPCNEQSRSQPWQIHRWATDLDIENILMENVWEFQNWCRLLRRAITYRGKRHAKGRPDPRHKGEYFRAFLNALSGLSYNLEWRIQRCADYGDPTSRRRLILMARKGKPIIWPEPTHGPGRAQPWKSARSIIDWSIKGKSLFGPDGKPRLCKNTVDRIIAGIEKYSGEPFVMHITHCGNHASRCHSLDKPLPTVTTSHRGEMALIQPMILKYYKTGVCKSVDLPLDTVTTKARFMLIESSLEGDVLTRMLKPHELSASHSFPTNYTFKGNLADQIEQIGNSVPVELATAHAGSILMSN